ENWNSFFGVSVLSQIVSSFRVFIFPASPANPYQGGKPACLALTSTSFHSPLSSCLGVGRSHATYPPSGPVGQVWHLRVRQTLSTASLLPDRRGRCCPVHLGCCTSGA